MKPTQIIAASIAAELRAHPEHWTQGAEARTSDGHPTIATDATAVCWCLWSHVIRRIHDSGLPPSVAALTFCRMKLASPELFPGTDAVIDAISTFNDRPQTTVDDIITVCDRAAEE